MTGTTRGGCLCGAVRFETSAGPERVDICHCRICQKATGQPFFARAVLPASQVEVAGPVVWFASSPGFERGFCPSCGTTLFARRRAGERVSIAIGAFDDPAPLRPQAQVWTSRRLPWLARLDADLPAWPEYAPA
jgi:hypothetical protein